MTNTHIIFVDYHYCTVRSTSKDRKLRTTLHYVRYSTISFSQLLKLFGKGSDPSSKFYGLLAVDGWTVTAARGGKSQEQARGRWQWNDGTI